jgi:hypothetical protein
MVVQIGQPSIASIGSAARSALPSHGATTFRNAGCLTA